MSDTQRSDRARQLESDVQATRDDLVATVEALADRLDPKTQMARAADRGRRLVHDATDPAADPTARRRARIALGVAAAVAVAVLARVVSRATRH